MASSYNNNNENNNISNVFHNKYLLTNILHQIEISENDTNSLKEGIIINNKIKFGEVTSLEWMVRNGQFDLLKFKLETGKQIDIDESAVRLLFNEYSLEKEFEIVDKDTFFKNYCSDRESYNSNYFQSFKDDQLKAIVNSEKLNEMLPFILSKCREQLLKLDLEKVLTGYESSSKYFKADLNLLNSFINNPTSIVPKVKPQVGQDVEFVEVAGVVEEKLTLTLTQPIQYRLILKSKVDVDWVIENIETIKTLHFNEHKQRDLFIFKFQSYHVIEYAKSKFQSIESLVGYFENDKKYEPTFIHSFSNAVNNCDVESLKKLQLDVGNYKFGYFELLKSGSNSSLTDKLIKQSIKFLNREAVHANTAIRERKHISFNGQTTSSLIALFEYLNATGYQLFKPDLFKLLVKSVASAATKNSEIDLSKLSIDFSQFQCETIQLLTESITNQVLPNVIQLILNSGFNAFSTNERQSLFENYWAVNSRDKRDFNFYVLHELIENQVTGTSTFRIKPFNHSCLFYGIQSNSLNYDGNDEDMEHGFTVRLVTYSNNFQSDITKSIKLLLGSSLKFNNQTGLMINYLFKRLIKVDGITFKQVDEIYQSIKSTYPEFVLEHSLYHSFYYLTIKSLKNTKLILDYFNFQLAGFEHHRFIEFDEMDVDYEITEHGVVYNDFRSLDKTQFTYDFVFGSSLPIVLDKLILNLLYVPFVNINAVSSPFTNNAAVQSNQILIEIQDLYYNLLLSTLENLLEFKQIDLFFKQLDIIQDQLANSTLRLGVYPTVKEGTRLFYYSRNLFTLAFKVLDSEQFDKFSSFQSYKSMSPQLFEHTSEIEKDTPLISKFKELIGKQ